MDGPSPSKETILGFQIQDEEGTAKDDSVIWCPYNDTSDIGPKGNLRPLDQADTVHNFNVAIPEGQWWEGSMPITMRPVSPLLTALFGAGGILNSAARDNYNKAPCFTVFRVDRVAGVQRVLSGMDCRVSTWRLRMVAGEAQPFEFSMDIRGKADYTTSATPSGSFGAPYLWKDCRIRIKLGAGAWAYEVNMKEAEIEGNENLIDIDAGMRLGQGPNPKRLDNEGEQDVTITLTRDLVDTILYDQWMLQRSNSSIDSGNAMAVEFILSSGGQTLTLTCNRCAFEDYSADLPGSKVGFVDERVVFRAYASADGATGALVCS